MSIFLVKDVCFFFPEYYEGRVPMKEMRSYFY